MKIIHFSDTHLGFNDLDILNSENINQREADFYDTFTQVIDEIIKNRPDFVVHTGDLFHRTSPTNRAISVALHQFHRLEKEKIKVIMIAGNHSTPRTILSSPILKIFDKFENMFVAYSEKYEKFEFDDIVFHAIPHINDENKILEEIDVCEKNISTTKKNILMMHCSVGATYLMSEFGEWVYPKNKEYLFKKMDYVALGHWHGFGNVGKHKNVYYSGSTERTSLNDKRDSKGYVKVKLSDDLKVKYKEIKIRKIESFEIDCENFEKSIENLKIGDVEGVLVEVKLINLTPLKSIEISSKEIKNLFEGAMFVTIKREFKEEINRDMENVETLSLEEYFLEYIKNSSDEDRFESLKIKIGELFNSYDEGEQ